MVIDMDLNRVGRPLRHPWRLSYVSTEKRPGRNCDTAPRPDPQPGNDLPLRAALDRHSGAMHRGHATGVDAHDRAVRADAGRSVRDADQRDRGAQSVPVVLPRAARGAAAGRAGHRAARAGAPAGRGGALL